MNTAFEPWCVLITDIRALRLPVPHRGSSRSPPATAEQCVASRCDGCDPKKTFRGTHPYWCV
ncbi:MULTISPECIES: hypothetical protein [unclassified Streptomyces]|uniref:hypothetical protein n=1 Tax=unclassified Streptomyces TaxID=2593676 RepID=UPI001BE89C17|nr:MULTISPECIES: hypothetical protein [unclassified Streptomyces]MBT2408563.1 hypothetical protein [Streptomyces sp. ISL-21]MBT2612668.1 hypothetical protein [Streptomyces sp. ISL-87]